jgi:hypothetical protein
MRYIIVSRGEQTAREFYRLSRPNPDPADITLYLGPYLTHADGREAIGLPDETVPIAPPAPDTELPPFVGLTNAERNAIGQWIRDQRGRRANPIDGMPPGRVHTHEQMVTDGWFPETEEGE